MEDYKVRIGVDIKFDASEADVYKQVEKLMSEHKLGEKIKELLVKEFSKKT